jgi:hypothetical protein
VSGTAWDAHGQSSQPVPSGSWSTPPLQKIPLYRKSANLLIQLGNQSVISLILTAAVLEYFQGSFYQLLLPGMYSAGMNLKITG